MAKREGILATLPATMMTAMASPMARPMPMTMEAAMPLLGGGDGYPEIGLDLGGAQGQAGLLVLPGDGPQGVLGHADDGGKDHHSQHQHGAEEAGTVRKMKELPQRRGPGPSCRSGRRPPRGCRPEGPQRARTRAAHLGRSHLGQEYSSQKSHRGRPGGWRPPYRRRRGER